MLVVNNTGGYAMKTRLMLLLIATLIFASCTVAPTVHRSSCSPGPKGNPKEIPIPIVFTPSGITRPDKDRIDCARPGDVIRYMLNGPPDITVSVDSDDDAAPWLKGSGKIFPREREGWFYVLVPVGAEEGDFKYEITAGTAVLDPEVRVRESY